MVGALFRSGVMNKLLAVPIANPARLKLKKKQRSHCTQWLRVWVKYGILHVTPHRVVTSWKSNPGLVRVWVSINTAAVHWSVSKLNTVDGWSRYLTHVILPAKTGES